MRTRYWMLVAALAIPTAAGAQTLDPAGLKELDDDDQATSAITYDGRSVAELEDMDVVRDGKEIGEIEEVLGNADGEIVAVVVEYGGFLGTGLNEKEVVMAIEDLQFGGTGNEATVALSDQELEGLQVWDD